MGNIAFYWFRRDLRLHDNHALYQALRNTDSVIPIFIFDKNILNELSSNDPRIGFIHDQLSLIKTRLNREGSDLLCFYGDPQEIWEGLITKYRSFDLYFNRDYEPYALTRDAVIQQLCKNSDIQIFNFKDHVVFESHEIRKSDGGVYSVYTSYKKKWLEEFKKNYHDGLIDKFPSELLFNKFKKLQPCRMVSMEELGFIYTRVNIPKTGINLTKIKSYDQTRDFPYLKNSTSRLGIHLRFGTISIRELISQAYHVNTVYLNELIWREFYSQILHSYPRLVLESFKPAYDRIKWINNKSDFEQWCNGMTGYPMVDAGMRELNSTGHMHNRLRMITASFLTKHLLIDWRWGESYFAQKLLDYELASNNGGWQWAAGCGTDAAPYFRIFNPALQQAKFDPDKQYIRMWIDEYGTFSYPKEMIDHKFARERCLRTYKEALNNN